MLNVSIYLCGVALNFFRALRTGSVEALRTGSFGALRTGSFRALRTGLLFSIITNRNVSLIFFKIKFKNSILKSELFSDDGTKKFVAESQGTLTEPQKLGYKVGQELLKKAGSNFKKKGN